MEKAPFLVIGNWKSNKTIEEAVLWFKEFASLWKQNPIIESNVHVILCPSYIHLVILASLIKDANLPIQLCVQDISPFACGTYTGAVAASMVKGLVQYVLIGHSERRTNFHEQDEELLNKMKQAQEVGLSTIYCIQNEQMQIPEITTIVAYEPMWAISKGDPYATKPEDPISVAEKITTIKQKLIRPLTVIYGGSTTPDNVAGYVSQPSIDGVLPGGASLKPDIFYRLLVNATT